MKKFFSKFYVALVFAFLYLPILVLIVFSFNESKGTIWTGFSFKWYGELVKNELIMTSLMNTLLIAIVASVFSAVLGTAAAFGMHNMSKFPKSFLKMPLIFKILTPKL